MPLGKRGFLPNNVWRASGSSTDSGDVRGFEKPFARLRYLMTLNRFRSPLVALIAIVVCVSATSAKAQVITAGNIQDTASAGAAAARAPGNMVSAGVTRALERAPQALGTIRITETARSRPISEVVAATLNTFFDQLNNAVLLFINLLRARDGLAPIIPGLGDLLDGGAGG